jgi:GAF domain-containing protein
VSTVDPGTARESGPVRTILQRTVDIARTVFEAYSASVLLLDEETGELAFEAVAHPAEQHLVGMRFAATEGIAGLVLRSGQTMLIDDLDAAPGFSRRTAEATGYVPTCMMAAPIPAPLEYAAEYIGVLQVLDRSDGYRGRFPDVTLLALLADQAAASLALILELRRSDSALRVLSERGGHAAAGAAPANTRALAAVEGILRRLADTGNYGDEETDDGVQLLLSLDRVLSGHGSHSGTGGSR